MKSWRARWSDRFCERRHLCRRLRCAGGTLVGVWRSVPRHLAAGCAPPAHLRTATGMSPLPVRTSSTSFVGFCRRRRRRGESRRGFQPRAGERSEVEGGLASACAFCAAPSRRLRPSSRARLEISPTLCPRLQPSAAMGGNGRIYSPLLRSPRRVLGGKFRAGRRCARRRGGRMTARTFSRDAGRGRGRGSRSRP